MQSHTIEIAFMYRLFCTSNLARDSQFDEKYFVLVYGLLEKGFWRTFGKSSGKIFSENLKKLVENIKKKNSKPFWKNFKKMFLKIF